MSASRQIAIGVFLIGGFILFGIGLFWIGDRRQLFNSNIDLYTEFSNISGLAEGAKVRVAGLDAGEVLDIQIPPNPDVRFRVHFRALSEFQSILRMNSTASIQNDGLVGNKFLQVDAGTSASMPVTSGATIPGRDPIEVSEVISRVNDAVKNANQAVTDIRGGVNDTIKTILSLTEQTTETVKDVSDQAAKLTRTGNAIGEDVRAIVSNVRSGRGTLGQLMNDDRLYQQLRAAAEQGNQVIAQFKETSNDLKDISNDLKQRDLGGKVEKVAGNLDTLTKEAINTIRSFQGPEGASGGLMNEVRQTLTSANETMANFADNSEALKRNFLFKGFFNKRGYFDLDDISVKEYRDGQVLRDRQKLIEWVSAADLFTSTPDGKEQLTIEGRRKLDAAMTNFLRYSKNEPLVVESFAGTGSESERVLRGRERGIMVSEYLVKKFSLKSNYVAVMPMNAGGPGDGDTRDGVGLALFPPKPAKK
jgi:phospholipid/cholesterol/gamma-HCH transport system substrate-binding protein